MRVAGSGLAVAQAVDLWGSLFPHWGQGSHLEADCVGWRCHLSPAWRGLARARCWALGSLADCVFQRGAGTQQPGQGVEAGSCLGLR